MRTSTQSYAVGKDGDGALGLAHGAHTDGVDADVVEVGELGCIHGFDLSSIVFAIGQQDDHLASGFGFSQAVHSLSLIHI